MPESLSYSSPQSAQGYHSRLCRRGAGAPPRSSSGGGGSNGSGEPVVVVVPQLRQKKQFRDANFPTDEEGRTYHLGTRRGEVANRILSVGSESRARILAEYLEPSSPGEPLFMLESSRGFLTVTGLHQGTRVSIVSTMMGHPNMDFVVRENRAVVDGQMAIIRLGTSGGLQPPASIGTVVVAFPGSVSIRRDPDAFADAASLAHPYIVSLPVAADPLLSHRLRAELEARLGAGGVAEGLNASADSFYSSQGRAAALFRDRNQTLLADLLQRHPSTLTLEMETFHLLDLARCSSDSIAAAAAHIVLADRQSNNIIEGTLPCRPGGRPAS